MTLRERVIVSAYTGYLMVQGDELKYLYEYAEKVTGIEGWQTIDFAKENLLQARSKNDFIELCRNHTPFEHMDYDELEKMIADDAELNERCTSYTLPGGQREISLWGKPDEDGARDLLEVVREHCRGLALWGQIKEEKDGYIMWYMAPIRGSISPEECYERWKRIEV